MHRTLIPACKACGAAARYANGWRAASPNPLRFFQRIVRVPEANVTEFPFWLGRCRCQPPIHQAWIADMKADLLEARNAVPELVDPGRCRNRPQKADSKSE